MNLEVRSVTVREVSGGDSLFPGEMNDLLCQVLSAISTEELHDLMDKHESDPSNLDGRIEGAIRSMRPDVTLHANHRVFEGARFAQPPAGLLVEGVVAAVQLLYGLCQLLGGITSGGGTACPSSLVNVSSPPGLGT